jgi:hypothetical protein
VLDVNESQHVTPISTWELIGVKAVAELIPQVLGLLAAELGAPTTAQCLVFVISCIPIQASHDAVPVAKVPEGQLVAEYKQLDAPTVLYVPIEHGAHTDAPTVLYRPLGQAAHDAGPLATVPDGHVVEEYEHVDAPSML